MFVYPKKSRFRKTLLFIFAAKKAWQGVLVSDTDIENVKPVYFVLSKLTVIIVSHFIILN